MSRVSTQHKKEIRQRICWGLDHSHESFGLPLKILIVGEGFDDSELYMVKIGVKCLLYIWGNSRGKDALGIWD